MMNKKKIKDLKVKFGSDDMVFWNTIIESHKREMEILEKSLKLTKAILDMAEKKYQEAEEENKKCI